jgi:hypothetical protein
MSKGSTTEESVKIQRTRVLDLKHRALPFITPWAIMFGVFVVSLITHWQASGPVALIFLTLMGPGLGVVTWITWGRRHEHAQVAATAFVTGMGLWLALATALGPLTSEMLWGLIFGGSFLCLAWNIRYAGITPTNAHDKVKTGPVDAVSMIKGLKNTVTGKARTVKDAGGVRAEVILNHPGGKNTTADVKRRAENLAGLYGVPPASVKVSEADRGGKTRVTVRMDNPTTDTVPYPGLSMPGKSITAGPLRTGVREDGQDSAHWITGDDEESRAASSTLYSGMTGAGKTRAYILALLEQVSRTDCAVPVIGDPEKFAMSFGMIMNYIPIAADGPEQVDQLIKNLPDAMRYRAALLGSLGYYDGWVPECWTKHRIPVQPIHVEEAGGYLAGNPEFFKALTLCRALGVPMSISIHMAKYNQLPTESRGQFGNSFAFGVKKIAEAAFALTAETIRAGGDPSRWANNYPGRNIAEVTGVPSDQWSLTHRAFKISTPEIVDTFDSCRNRDPGIAVCDEGTFELLSRGIVRPQRMIVGVPDWKSVDTTPTVDLSVPQSVEPVRDFAVIAGGAETQSEAETPDQQPDTGTAYRMIEDRIEELELSGVTEITADDFDDLKEDLARHRTWIYKSAFPVMVKRGRIARLSGKGSRYRIIPVAQREEG